VVAAAGERFFKFLALLLRFTFLSLGDLFFCWVCLEPLRFTLLLRLVVLVVLRFFTTGALPLVLRFFEMDDLAVLLRFLATTLVERFFAGASALVSELRLATLSSAFGVVVLRR